MDGGQFHDVLLTVDDPDHLFEGGASLSRPLATPGMEVVLGQLSGVRVRGPVRLTIQLPAERISPEVRDRIPEAVRRYCRERIQHNEHEIKTHRRDGLEALLFGLPILILGLLLSEIVRRAAGSGLTSTFFSDGILLVVAWVGLWYPFDVLIYSSLPYRRENRRLASLASGEIIVEALRGEAVGEPKPA